MSQDLRLNVIFKFVLNVKLLLVQVWGPGELTTAIRHAGKITAINQSRTGDWFSHTDGVPSCGSCQLYDFGIDFVPNFSLKLSRQSDHSNFYLLLFS